MNAPSNPPEISVIVPCHNGQGRLAACLEALCGQELAKHRYEILVVDNASDPALALPGSAGDPDAPAIRIVSETRLGLHFARNTGARSARAAILAYTDDDVVVSPGWLAGLLHAMEDPSVGAAGGEIRARWEQTPPAWVLRYAPGYLSMLDHGPEAKFLETPDLYGCNLAVRKEALFQVGGFHPEAFGQHWIGDGETGMLMDLMAAGYRLRYQTDAWVHHCIPLSRCTEAYLSRRFQNQASCDGYTWYRRELPGRRELIQSAWRHLRRRQRFLRQARGESVTDDANRHARFLATYHARRAQYDFKLARSAGFRRRVLERNWL